MDISNVGISEMWVIIQVWFKNLWNWNGCWKVVCVVFIDILKNLLMVWVGIVSCWINWGFFVYCLW